MPENKNDMSKIKGKLNSLEETLSRLFITISDCDAGIISCTVDEIEVRKRFIETNYETYKATYLLFKEDGAQDENYVALENNYITALAKINKILSKSTITAENVSASQSTMSHIVQSQVRLPNVTLPKFSGNLAEWNIFFDLFQALIDRDTNLTDVQKLYYLRAYLEREPAYLIAGLPLVNSSYQHAMTILRERYDNRKSIINTYLKNILDLKSISKPTSESFREFSVTIKQNFAALKALNLPVDTWDVILVYILSNKLDYNTHKAFELEYSSSKEYPTLNNLLNFIDTRALALENVNSQLSTKLLSSKPNSSKNNYNFFTRQEHSSNSSNLSFSKRVTSPLKNQKSKVTNTQNCVICKGNCTRIFFCPRFKSYNIADRRQSVKEHNLCFNCLSPLHSVLNCASKSSCRVCDKRHHSMLHLEEQPSDTVCDPIPSTSSVTCHNYANYSQILLATAIVRVSSGNGQFQLARAILDSGSQTHFVTEKLAESLNANCLSKSLEIRGLANRETNITKIVQLQVSSYHSTYNTKIQCAVLKQITSVLPQQQVNMTQIQIPTHFQLADPKFGTPGLIDILLGANVFYEIIAPGNYSLGFQLPSLQNTKLGWVVAGPAPIISSKANSKVNTHVAINLFNIENEERSLNELLTKFWSVEEANSTSRLSIDEEADKKLFSSLKIIDSRFQTDLLFTTNCAEQELGNSYLSALSRFRWLERKLSTNPQLREAYVEFINEFISTGHAQYITFQFDPTKGANCNGYFLPHHPVLKPSSTTTKLRVVFDASAKTDSGKSLNDTQLIGCPVQAELFDILIRFRTYRYVFCCDIEKMYRQVLISPHHRKYQRFIWRESPHLPLRHLELNRVTYGVRSAPFLATRILTHIASLVQKVHPDVSRTLRENTYVDDVFTGDDDLNSAVSLRENLINVLKAYSFPLRKFCSNSSQLLSGLDKSKVESLSLAVTDDHCTIKTLGLRWDPLEDNFLISVPTVPTSKLTKRSVLSFIAGIFDPLGLVAPVTVTAKIFMQRLWSKKLHWDCALSQDLIKLWIKTTQNFHKLNDLAVRRWIFHNEIPNEVEIHAFCDASKVAYGACIYVRGKNSAGIWHTQLLWAKSRVAPLKTLTMPRLELQAAILLSKLVTRCLPLLSFTISRTLLWTDSTIVLGWLKSPLHKLDPVVASRVAQLHELTNSFCWSHVQTSHNPADILSRGVSPERLLNLTFWWTGPNFLTDANIPPTEINLASISDSSSNHKKVPNKSETVLNEWHQWFERFSNFTRIVHSLAYVFRFIQRTRRQNYYSSTQLSLQEIEKSTTFIITQIQTSRFSTELSQLKHGYSVSTSLRDLFPFVDRNGLLRVGGRLGDANIPYDAKHPIILPSHHHVTSLIFRHEHFRLLHASPTLTLHSLRQQYWPLGGRREAKRILSSCLQCFKTRKITASQLMGSLPKERVTSVRPFHTVGVDFAGPVDIKQSRMRKVLISKGYIAVFVCLSTHCLHIELVSALTTEAFLMCLNRFIARRGRPTTIFSDNGKNFIGASNKLHELYNLFLSQHHQTELHNFILKNKITWKFIPPFSPNFGGIWEAGVKSIKSHLNRILRNQTLTYEEFYTVLTQIEAVLNSRPLGAFSDDPKDFNVLTLGHFLIHENPSSYPQPIEVNVPENRLSFWRKCQQLADHFWQKWHLEVLNLYQQRTKWNVLQNNIKPNELVLLKNDNLPPYLWKTARVIETFPGRDGLVRTMKIRSPEGDYIRSISQIVPIPTNN